MTMTPTSLFPRLRLRAQEDRRLTQGHLWIYSNEVDVAQTPLQGLRAGDQVLVESHGGKALGVAFVQPNSLICGRLFSRQADQGMDAALLRTRLRRALELRSRHFSAPWYRWVYGDSDLLPGLVVDRYGDIVVLQINLAGMENLRQEIVAAIVDLIQPRGVLYKNDTSSRVAEGLPAYVELAWGEVPEFITVQENGCEFLIDPRRGQKTGWFYDHRPTRQWLMPRIAGARVLDVFSYVGAWSLAAARHVAREVLAIDASQPALDLLQMQAQQLGVGEKVTTLCADAFAALTDLRQRGEVFDVVIIDPPAFIKRRKDHKNGLAAYRRLNELAMRLLGRDGLLISCSCSMHLERSELVDILRAASRHIDRHLQILHHGHQGEDHPIHPAIAETEYLKAIAARVLLAD